MTSLSWGSLFCSNWIYAQHHVIIIFKAKFKAKNQGKIQSKISDKNSKQNALEMLHTKYEASIKNCLEGLKSLMIQIHSLFKYTLSPISSYYRTVQKDKHKARALLVHKSLRCIEHRTSNN